ncbi:MAG TPA: hypothetical protein VNY36_07375 [Bacteroidia bacterium]|nr:hypothetical protein [Bacteroidia bacterium]
MKTTKTISALLIFMGIINCTIAQDVPPPSAPVNEGTPPSGYFEIGIGAAEPINSFAREVGPSYGGYALPGANLNISFGIPIAHSNFGVALMYNYAWNFHDINSYVDNIQVTDQSNTYMPLGQDVYRESFILGGLFVTIPLQRVSFDFRLMGGLAICALPEVDYGADATSPTASQNFEWDTYNSTSTSFASDLGMNIRFRIYRTSIMADIDYLYADPMVNTTQQYTDQFGNSTFSHIGGMLPISIMSYSIGIGYQFW